MEALTHGIVNKILHTPITRLKTAAARGRKSPRWSSISRIFNCTRKIKRSRKSRPPTAEAGSGQGADACSLRIGSRGSQLALWQANHIAAQLRERGHEVEIEIIHTTGDKILDVALCKGRRQRHVHQGD